MLKFKCKDPTLGTVYLDPSLIVAVTEFPDGDLTIAMNAAMCAGNNAVTVDGESGATIKRILEVKSPTITEQRPFVPLPIDRGPKVRNK